MSEKEEIKSPISPIGILAILGLVFLFSGINSTFYTIEPEEVGVVLRLGKFSRIAKPGLNFKLPFDIENVYKVKIRRIAKEEFGFRTISAGVKTIYQKEGHLEESLLLTGDLNVVDLEWIIQYRVEDPVKYLFNLRNVGNSIRDVSEAVMRQVVGERSFDEVLSNRNEVAGAAIKNTQLILDKYKCGIKVLTVKLQDVNPPQAVKQAFNEVNESIQDKERLINEAQEIYNKKVPKAKGEARRTITQSEGYALKRVNRATGDISRFNAMYKEYIKAKEITKKRLYIESMESLLKDINKIYIVDEEQKGLLPFVNFSGN